ncbi:MAG: DUF4317 domain-containing protein [Lachnospiraceae bacterium]|nr:DUF4317 domain-containing protein [Lachnospiraceae bacterium]
MNKKEVHELRRRFRKEKCTIRKMCGCYVNGDGERITSFRETFAMLSEEEQDKYFEIFKKGMSGTFGHNLFCTQFGETEDAEGNPGENLQELFLKLRDSELEDDAILDEFYERVITAYGYRDNYLILLAHDAYDVPSRTRDGIEMEDASEEVYSYVLCLLCPVNLTDYDICYDAQSHSFRNTNRRWKLEAPMHAMLFPMFTDRMSDITGTLFYSRDAKDIRTDMLAALIGGLTPISAQGQRDIFGAIVEETLGGKCEYDDVRNIQDILSDRIEESKDAPEPLVLSKADISDLLADSGVSEENLQRFDTVYDSVLPKEQPLQATNIINTKKMEVKLEGITVSAKPERARLIKTQIIDGRNCLVIPIDDEEVFVNGIAITGREKEVKTDEK